MSAMSRSNWISRAQGLSQTTVGRTRTSTWPTLTVSMRQSGLP